MIQILSKIKAEIERLKMDANILCEKNRSINEQAHQYYGGKRDGYKIAIRLIESLEKEADSELEKSTNSVKTQSNYGLV